MRGNGRRHCGTIAGFTAHQGTTATVSASFGMLDHGSSGYELGQLLAHADVALYRAKRAGRNCVMAYDPADSGGTAVHRGIASALVNRLRDQARVQPFRPVLRAEAALLNPAERRIHRGHDDGVDAHHAGSSASPINMARLADSVNA